MKAQFFPIGDTAKRHSTPFVTYFLIAINVIVFLWSLTSPVLIIETYGFIPALFVPLTLITSMFLHGGIGHILGNMWFLFIFGDNIEDRLGKARYILFYIAAGIAAVLVHYVTNPSSVIPTIGASGAISGVLGAYLVFFPREGVHIGSLYGVGTLPAYFMIGFWFFMQLIFAGAGLLSGTGSGIAFFAHIGGFLFGVVIAWFYKKPKRRRRR